MTDQRLIKKAKSKKEVLNKKIAELYNQYTETQDSNSYAAGTYGSELCAGDMLGKETRILEEISELRRKVSTLNQVISGELDLSEIDEINLALGKLEAEMIPYKLKEQELRSRGAILVAAADLLQF